MSSAEFAEWMAYDRLEPVGQRRDDVRMAFLAALIANQWRGKESEPVTPDAILRSLPWWDEEQERRQVLAGAAPDAPAEETGAPPGHWTTRWVERAWAAMQAGLAETEE